MKRFSILLVAAFTLFWAATCIVAQVPENAPRPAPQFPGRKPPAMTMEKAVEIARKALELRKTPLRGRFISKAECVMDPKKFPHAAAQSAKGPFWHIVLSDPEYADENYPVAPIRVFVFSEKDVALLVPE
jgi:hypothetical protein